MKTNRLLAQFVNSKITMEEILSKYMGINDLIRGSTCFCPFHQDSNKSAKFYEDGAIYCFAESKQYTPYSALRSIGKTADEIATLSGYDPQVERSPVATHVDLQIINDMRTIFKRGKSLKEMVLKFYEFQSNQKLSKGNVPESGRRV